MATASVQKFFQRSGQSLTEYFKRLGNDYATVAKDTITGCKEKPVKAAIVFSGIGFLTYAYNTTPSEIDLQEYLCKKRQQLVLVPQSEHNPQTVKELTRRNYLLSQDRLHYYNLWFLSLLVSSKHNNKLRIYSSQDPNLKDWPWIEFWNNIVDVGFLGKWFYMDKQFENYDINYDEINLLPDDKP